VNAIEEINSGVNIPTRKRGRPSVDAAAQYEAQVKAFCDFIKNTAEGLDFRPSARGWAYMLENEGLIDKSQLDLAQNCINDARKSGALPLDICSEDAKREWHNVEELDNPSPTDEASRIKRSVDDWISNYRPRSFWQGKSHYIQIVVEKIDLRELFLPVCERWHIPIANGGGWSDINMRGELMERFRDNLEDGQVPVVLYCGDFDPVGLQIGKTLRENIRQLSAAVGWWDDNLIVDRFGLNFDFIQEHRITWIDNLQTSGRGAINDLSDPRHKHHLFPHVQDYLAQYGARKVEANALVTRAGAGRQLCEEAILKYMVRPDLPDRFQEELRPERETLRRVLRRLAA
jgi:hypothetical protein